MASIKTIVATLLAASLVPASIASAAATPAAKCQSSKTKTAGAYYACRQKVVATALRTNATPDYTKCQEKFLEKWNAAENAAPSDCPDNFTLASEADELIAGEATDAANRLAGIDPPPPPTPGSCGDGLINVAGEHCDGSALDGQTCASFGKYGTLACTAGCDFNLSGCTSCPSPGVSYGGACWLLGAASANCTTTCAAAGMTYSDATGIVAGSSGSDGNCVAVLDLIGAPGGALDNAGGNCTTALGCAVDPMFGYRARCGTPATDTASTGPGVSRACACK